MFAGSVRTVVYGVSGMWDEVGNGPWSWMSMDSMFMPAVALSNWIARWATMGPRLWVEEVK